MTPDELRKEAQNIIRFRPGNIPTYLEIDLSILQQQIISLAQRYAESVANEKLEEAARISCQEEEILSLKFLTEGKK